MCCPHRPVPGANQAATHVFHAELRQSPDGADDIENRIHRPDLVQMNLLRWHPVNLALRGGNRPKGGVRLHFHRFWGIAAGDECADLVDVPAVRLGRDRELHLPADELPAEHLANVYSDVRQSEPLGQGAEPRGIEAYAEKCAERHVASDAAERIENRRAHDQNR